MNVGFWEYYVFVIGEGEHAGCVHRTEIKSR